jgi:hypothetical protein
LYLVTRSGESKALQALAEELIQRCVEGIVKCPDNAYRGLVGKSEGKRPLGIPECRWEDIKMDLK